ncbi:MAG: carbon-nitrogen hydrolase family protein [Acidiferrobacterales bacterium]|nr:carbon-nitrogen hydrolase family protein [Acidiferrobacterales bacterium]
MMPRVAAIQMNSGDDVEHNLRSTEELVTEAKRQSAVIAVLPECFSLMAPNHQCRLSAAEPAEGGGTVWTFLSDLARREKIWILAAGIFTQCENTRKVRNTSWLFDHCGESIARYDKINLFDIELPDGERYSESSYTVAGSEIVAEQTPAGVAGITVCYDLRFPALYEKLTAKDAIWFAIPSAFAYTTGCRHWEVLLRARAIENHAYVVAPAQWGRHPGGRTTYGHTMIVDPWGEILAQQGRDDGVITADLDAGRVNEIRKRFSEVEQ